MTFQQAFNSLITKIQTNFTWLNNNKANVSHTHNQYQEKILTGYSKAASASAISASDTVNQALGKLEKALDGAAGGGDEIPLLFGQWSEMGSPSENWVEVDGETALDAADYPEIWEILTGILAGTLEGGDIYVISAADAEDILESEDTDEETLANKRDLAYKYIVDTTEETFILPRCVPDSRCLGNNNLKLITSDSDRGGYYEINNNGRYYENSCVARLEKVTTSGTKYTPIPVTGKQIVLKFIVPADKDGTAFPASDVLLFEKSNQGNKIYTLKNFQNNAAYTFTYDTTYSDIKLYLLKQSFDIDNKNCLVLKFALPYGYIEVTENNSKVIVQCSVGKTTKSSIDRNYIPDENFIPTASANSPDYVSIWEGLKFLKKTGDSTNGYHYSDDWQYYNAGTYTTADKTVLDTTVTTPDSYNFTSHKVTEWDDSTTDITLSSTAKKYCDDKEYNYVVTPIEVNFSKTLLDGNLELCKTAASQRQTPGGNTIYEINNFYFGAEWEDIDNDGFSVSFPVYDEVLNDSEVLSDAIPTGETSSMVSFTIVGHVVPPLVSEYSSLTDFRLYIKLK